MGPIKTPDQAIHGHTIRSRGIVHPGWAGWLLLLFLFCTPGCEGENNPDSLPANALEKIHSPEPLLRLNDSNLVDAARRCEPESFRLLLEQTDTKTMNAQVSGGETALNYAVWFQRTPCVRMLIEAGAHVNTRTDGKETALHYALHQGDAEITSMLLLAGADFQAVEQDNGYSVLMVAAGLGRIPETRVLVALGSDQAKRDYDGRTALMHSIRGRHEKVAELLINHKSVQVADVHRETSLYYAIRSRNLSLVARILEAGANPNALNEFGETPLMLAASMGSDELVRLLLSFGADESITDATNTYSAATIARANGFSRIVSLLESPLRRAVLKIFGI